MDIPESIFDSIDLLIDIPKTHESDIIHQIGLIQNQINDLLINKKSFYSQEKVAHLYYLLGYVYYLHPKKMRDSLIFQKVEKLLNTAKKLDEKHSMAKLYLGYNAYDNQDYILAIERFDLIDPNSIAPYFYLRLLETRLCCSIRYQGLIYSLDELESFVQEAGKHNMEDIYPYLLARTIEEGYQRPFLESQHSRLKQLMESLDNASGFSNWFTKLIM